LIFYNSITELERKEVEDALKKVFEISIWPDSNIKIKPKPILKVEESIEVVEPKKEENGTERSDNND
jgi:hypothetical protein